MFQLMKHTEIIWLGLSFLRRIFSRVRTPAVPVGFAR